ncbi:MAG TPA: DUF4142 domain-containing protein [Gemmatimonadaceae bacterium]|nr:DUF4142 domain-containing protein [Gemmatimonadaceae bacterium]
MLRMVSIAAVVGLASAFAMPATDSPKPHKPNAASATSRRALDDATIVAIFDEANTEDIETSSLAAKRGSSPDVRALGKQFARDHTAVRQQGRDLAKKLGVKPTKPNPDPGAAAAAAALKDLQSKHGADFDKAYLAHEVAFHQQVIDALNNTLIPAIRNAELKAFVQKIVPAFEGHLAAAKNLQAKIGQ